jgi:hypothetical protein
MLILFAIGVVIGTILSFEMGLLWPNFMATFGDVFGLAFGIEGFSFFAEAIFIAMYVYGWERFSPRRHLLLGVPVVIAGVTGSLMVISVNGWMNHPASFDVVGGRVANVDPLAALFNSHLWHELIHMYVAGYIVVGCVVGNVYARSWLRGNRDRYVRTGLIVAVTGGGTGGARVVRRRRLSRTDGRGGPADQVRGLRRGRRYDTRRIAALRRRLRERRGARRHQAAQGAVAAGAARSQSARTGLRSVPAADRPPVNRRWSLIAPAQLALYRMAISGELSKPMESS